MPEPPDDVGMRYFEIGAFKTPLQRLKEEYATRSEVDPAPQILDAAYRLAIPQPLAVVSVERERFRREEVDPELIDHLADLSAQIGEESYAEPVCAARTLTGRWRR